MVVVSIIASSLLGAMIFFSTIIAPTVFTVLEPSQASRFLRKLFPRMFLLGIFVGLAIMVAGLILADIFSLAVGFLIFFGFFINKTSIMPKINILSDAISNGDDDKRKEFGRMHALSVGLFLVCGLVCIVGISLPWIDQLKIYWS